LPQSSVPLHVLVMLYEPGQLPCVVESTKEMLTLVSQASVAVGAVKLGAAGQLIVAVAPCPLNTGAVLSIILMV
jgi:hypothetical protein